MPIARLIRQFRGEAAEIFDLESEGHPQVEKDLEIEALFGEDFFTLPTQERREAIRVRRKLIGAKPFRLEKGKEESEEESMPHHTVAQALAAKNKVVSQVDASGSSALPPKKK